MADIFNPIKEETGGKNARRAIWTTRSIELALKGKTEGKRLHANPFYDNNVKILKGDLTYQRTDDEIVEWKRCKEDIIYFVEQYCKLLTPEGIRHVTLRDYQVRYLRHVQANQLSIGLTPRQAGKCVDFTTLVDIRADFVGGLKHYMDSHYYILNDNCYRLPLFELYNLYDGSFKWKIKYQLFKLIYKLQCLEKKKERIVKNIGSLKVIQWMRRLRRQKNMPEKTVAHV